MKIGEMIWRGSIAAFVLLCLWQLLITVFNPPPYLLPTPLAVIRVIWDSSALLAYHAGVTSFEILAGLALGLVLGVGSALAMAFSKPLRNVLQPLLAFSQIIPIFALAPLLTLWLGFGFWPKVIMALIIIYFPITSAFFDGLQLTKQELLDLGSNAGATPMRLMFLLRVPAAIPIFLTGLRLALIYAPIGAVIGEWVGASQGLGYLMLYANGRAQASLMFAAMFVLAALTVAVYASVMGLAKVMLANYLR